MNPADATVPAEDAAGIFPVTRWSRVVRARESNDANASRAALDELCQTYWRPVVNFLTALGCGQDAADVAQDFFSGFLRREGFNHANPELGRLRALLKTSVRNHFLQWRRNRAALHRGGGIEPQSLDDLPVEPASATDETAAASYDREWALTILERALTKLRENYSQRERQELFVALKPTLFSTGKKLSDEQAVQLGFTPNALAVEQHRARRRFADLLRAEVADTVADPREVQAELLHLLKLLAHAGADAHD